MKNRISTFCAQDTSYGDAWGRLSMPGRGLERFFYGLGAGKGGIMINQDDIESGDFSECLPKIIARLAGIGQMVVNHGEHKVEFFNVEDQFYAIGDIMTEAADDLQVINRALYGKEGCLLSKGIVNEERGAP